MCKYRFLVLAYGFPPTPKMNFLRKSKNLCPLRGYDSSGQVSGRLARVDMLSYRHKTECGEKSGLFYHRKVRAGSVFILKKTIKQADFYPENPYFLFLCPKCPECPALFKEHIKVQHSGIAFHFFAARANRPSGYLKRRKLLESQ